MKNCKYIVSSVLEGKYETFLQAINIYCSCLTPKIDGKITKVEKLRQNYR